MAPLATYRETLKAAKRRAILDAALTVFLKSGYDHATLQEIAKVAGLSTGTLFNHFKTKYALFGAIMASFWEVEPGHTKPDLPHGAPESALLSTGHDYARLLCGPHTAGLFRIIIAEAPRFPELGRALWERGKAPYLNRLLDYLAAEVQAGNLIIKDVPLSARQFLGMINDVIFWPSMLIMEYVVTAADVERAVREATTTFLARYGAPRTPAAKSARLRPAKAPGVLAGKSRTPAKRRR